MSHQDCVAPRGGGRRQQPQQRLDALPTLCLVYGALEVFEPTGDRRLAERETGGVSSSAVGAREHAPNRDIECANCTTDAPRPSSSYSAHNPSLTENLAFVSWHSGGLQAIDISDPKKPTQAAEFVADPLPFVFQEDPALSAGQDKVVAWSFPIIQDGLIYMADVRNGLYILKYKGPFASEVNRIDFLEGNSNLGDALRLGRL